MIITISGEEREIHWHVGQPLNDEALLLIHPSRLSLQVDGDELLWAQVEFPRFRTDRGSGRHTYIYRERKARAIVAYIQAVFNSA